jgi:hypothetical protein
MNPLEIKQVVSILLSKDRDDRFEDAHSAQVALQKVCARTIMYFGMLYFPVCESELVPIFSHLVQVLLVHKPKVTFSSPFVYICIYIYTHTHTHTHTRIHAYLWRTCHAHYLKDRSVCRTSTKYECQGIMLHTPTYTSISQAGLWSLQDDNPMQS